MKSDTTVRSLKSSPYAGRWVAVIRGRVVAQGGTPEQALVAAQSRHKEIPTVTYIPAASLPFSSSPLLARLVDTLSEKAVVYAVGGVVRDALLGRLSHDWDFAVSGSALPLARRVADQLGGAYFPMDVEHDTARIILIEDDGSRINLDFAGLRGGNLETDLRARDFTVNAMAVDVRQPDALLDPLGGLDDLRAKCLRACTPTSMSDDPIRVLRGVRQAAALGFHIDPDTRRLMREAVPGLPNVSPERRRDEIFKILDGRQPATCLRALEMLDVLPHTLPELSALKGVQQSPPHTADVWTHTLNVVTALEEILTALAPDYDPDKANNLMMGLLVLRLGRFRQALGEHFATQLNTDRTLRPLLFLAALYHDAAKPATRTQDDDGRIRFFEHDQRGAELIFKRAMALRLSNPEVDRIKLIVRHHMRPLLLMQAGMPTARSCYRFFRETGAAGVDICLLSLADTLGTYGTTLSQIAWAAQLDVIRSLLEAWWERPEQVVSPPALLNGNDLIRQFALSPGPQIGQLLEAVREAQAAGEISTLDEALDLVKHMLETGPLEQ
jgi:tRNA nucleotidyltransferase/poly(A) polymerase